MAERAAQERRILSLALTHRPQQNQSNRNTQKKKKKRRAIPKTRHTRNHLMLLAWSQQSCLSSSPQPFWLTSTGDTALWRSKRARERSSAAVVRPTGSLDLAPKPPQLDLLQRTRKENPLCARCQTSIHESLPHPENPRQRPGLSDARGLRGCLDTRVGRGEYKNTSPVF